MRDISYILAILGVLALFASAVSWKEAVGEPGLVPTLGRIDLYSRGVRSAAVATIVAFGLGSAAAVVAILGWFARG